MKKNVLALSIAAMIGGLGFAGAASAQTVDTLTVNESGLGHMLLVPYYTAQNNNMTVFHMVNTDSVNGKAMKVRFRGAANSDDVLDFQVFLSPGDVWTGAVVKGGDADGRAQLVTADGSCTLPAIAKNEPVNFIYDRLPSWMDGVAKANSTREGYIEIFNMADVKSGSDLFKATKHVNGVAPCTDAALSATLMMEEATPGLAAPTGGLMGSWYIINVPSTLTFGGSTTNVLATGATRNVFSAQANGAPRSGLFSADPLFKNGLLETQKFDMPDFSTPFLGVTPTTQAGADTQANALTQLLARTAVMNQYAQDSNISAKTDWVFSMPTRRYNVAANYNVTPGNAGYRVYNSAVGSFFTAGNTSVNATAGDANYGQICLSSTTQIFLDREETAKTTGAVFSPGNVTKLPLCGEVSVMSFASGSVLGAAVAKTAASGTYTNGWGRINFAEPGIPVLGGAYISLRNPSASAGVSGNYGLLWPHSYISALPPK